MRERQRLWIRHAETPRARHGTAPGGDPAAASRSPRLGHPGRTSMMHLPVSSTGPAVADPMLTRAVPIRKVIWENDDTFTLTLDIAEGLPGYSFLPGQFNMVYVYG